MNTSDTSINIGESMYDILTGVSTYYGLTWYQVKPGILIYNGTEYFLLKLKRNHVTSLWHQNHGKTGKQISLPCEIEDINNDIIHTYFHSQPWKDTENTNIKRALIYIYHHGTARRNQDTKRRMFLQSVFA